MTTQEDFMKKLLAATMLCSVLFACTACTAPHLPSETQQSTYPATSDSAAESVPSATETPSYPDTEAPTTEKENGNTSAPAETEIPGQNLPPDEDEERSVTIPEDYNIDDKIKNMTFYGKRYPNLTLKKNSSTEPLGNRVTEYKITVDISYPFSASELQWYDTATGRELPFMVAKIYGLESGYLQLPLYDTDLIKEVGFIYEGVTFENLTSNIQLPDYFSNIEGEITETKDGRWQWRAKEGVLTENEYFTYTSRPTVTAITFGKRCYVLLAGYEYDFLKCPKIFLDSIGIYETAPTVSIDFTDVLLPADLITPEPKKVYTVKDVSLKGSYYEGITEDYAKKYTAELEVLASFDISEKKHSINGKEANYATVSITESGRRLLYLPLFDIDHVKNMKFRYEGVKAYSIYYSAPEYWKNGTFYSQGKANTWRSGRSYKNTVNGFTYTTYEVIKAIEIGKRCYTFVAGYEYEFSEYPKIYEGLVKAIENGVAFNAVFTEVELPVDIPASISDFVYILQADGTAVITGYTGDSGIINVPSQIDGHTVTAIGKDAFREWMNRRISQVTIPNTVKRIEDRAFYYCSKLETVTLSEGLEYIGDHAFSLTNLKELKIPDSVTHIGKRVCEYNLSQYARVSKTVLYLGNGFADPAAVKAADLCAEKVVLKNGEVIMPYNVTANAEAALTKDLSITFGYLPGESFTEYDDVIYAGTVNADLSPAATLSLPSLKRIKKANITGGGNITIPASAIIDEGAFSGCDINTLTLTGNASTVTPYAFRDAKIKKIVIPSTVTVIEEGAFMNAEIETVVLPASIKRIEKYAFVGFKGKIDVAYGANLTSYSELSGIYGKMTDRMQAAIYMVKITDRELDSRYYLGEDGYYHIKGCDSISLPAKGKYLNYEDDIGFAFFAAEENILSKTEKHLKENGFFISGNKLWLSYGDGSSPLEITSVENGEKYTLKLGDCKLTEVITKRLTDAIAYGVITYETVNANGSPSTDSVGIIVRNKGESAEFTHTNIQFIDDRYGFYNDKYVTYAAGMRIVNMYITENGGRSFESNHVNHCVKRASDNAILGIYIPTVVNESCYYNDLFAVSEGFTYLNKIYPHNYLLRANLERSDHATNSFTVGKPYIDGSFGYYVLSCRFSSLKNADGSPTLYYVYFVTFNGGESWELFDPKLSASSKKEEISVYRFYAEEEYDGNLLYRNDDGVSPEMAENIIIDPLAWYYDITPDHQNRLLFNTAIDFKDNSNVPAYCGIYNSSNRIVSKYVGNGENALYISYNNYEKTVSAPTAFTDKNGDKITLDMYIDSNLPSSKLNYYVSKELTWYFNKNVLVISTDAGSSFRHYVFDSNIESATWLSENEIYVVCFTEKEKGEKEYSAFSSSDNGLTFTQEETVARAGSFGMVFNGVEYRVTSKPVPNSTSGSEYMEATAYIDGKPAEGYETVSGIHYLYKTNGTQSMPYFSGNFGIWAFGTDYYHGLETVYISFDCGKSWYCYCDSNLPSLWYDSPMYAEGK